MFRIADITKRKAEVIGQKPMRKFFQAVKNTLTRSPERDSLSLSEKVKIRRLNYKIVSKPLPIKGKLPEGYEVVAIIDSFLGKESLINGLNGLSHGEVVKDILTHGIDDKIAVLAYDAALKPRPMNSVLKNILKMKKSAEFGQYIKKLNISRGLTLINDYVTYAELSSLTGEKINSKNVIQQKQAVIATLKKTNPLVYESITLINKLIDSGVEVYVSAGNEGRHTVDLFAFSKAKIIGATDAEGVITRYSSESPLVTHYARGNYAVYKGENTLLKKTVKNPEEGFYTSEIHIKDKIFTQEMLKEKIVSKDQIQEILKEIKESKSTESIPEILAKKGISKDNIFEIGEDFFKLSVHLNGGKNFNPTEFKARLVLEKHKYKDTKYVRLDKYPLHFKEDASGNLFVDYDGSNSLGQVKMLGGTSLATPTKIREDILGEAPIAASCRLTTHRAAAKYLKLLDRLTKSGVLKGKEVEDLSGVDFMLAKVPRKEFLELHLKIDRMV